MIAGVCVLLIFDDVSLLLAWNTSLLDTAVDLPGISKVVTLLEDF